MLARPKGLLGLAKGMPRVCQRLAKGMPRVCLRGDVEEAGEEGEGVGMVVDKGIQEADRTRRAGRARSGRKARGQGKDVVVGNGSGDEDAVSGL